MGRTGVVSLSPARLRRARQTATPTPAELAARAASGRSRAPRGITQRELAARSGVSENVIRGVETDSQRPDPRVLWELAAALEVSPAELLDDGPTTLRRLRAIAGRTQARLAAMADITPSRYGYLESGERRLLPGDAEALAAALSADGRPRVSAAEVVAAHAEAGDGPAPVTVRLPGPTAARVRELQLDGEAIDAAVIRLLHAAGDQDTATPPAAGSGSADGERAGCVGEVDADEGGQSV